MRAASLFTGCGGMDLAFERAGFETAVQCEIDKDCLAVLERHWPGVRRENDVRSIHVPKPSGQEREGGTEPRGPGADGGGRADGQGGFGPAAADRPTGWGAIDVVHFGSPCQDLSSAGKRAGFAGARSGLFIEAVKAVRYIRPAFAVWENVPGALSSSDGRDFGTALDLLADAGAVDIAWRVLDAQFVGGCELHVDESGIGPVPQARRRVLVVADFRGQRAGQILFEPDGGGRYPAALGKEGEGVAATLSAGSHGPGSQAAGRRREDDVNLTVFPVQTPDIHEHKAQHGDGYRTAGEPSYTVDATHTHGVAIAAPLMGHHHRNDADSATNHVVAGTVSAKFAKGSGGPSGAEAGNLAPPQPGYAVRRFTPRECERLQGLPDDWTRWRADGTELSDSARYRMIGNSVAVPVVQWVAARIRAALAAS